MIMLLYNNEWQASRVTHFYTITREVEVPREYRTGIYSTDNTGTRRLDAILEFCREPRSGQEIIEHIGFEYRQWSKNKYIRPLLESGRLKTMLP
jgi:hypothetical protein